MKLTKQDILHVKNVLMLMGKGKFELAGAEIQFANKALEFLARIRDEGIKEIEIEEAVLKAEEEVKAEKVKDALQKTKAVIESIIEEPPAEPKAE